MTTPQHAGRVLVVDDEALNRELLRDALESRDYEVREASSGEAALSSIADWVPDVVLLDVSMAGLDGIQVCRRLKAGASTRAIPVIMVTAHADRRDRLDGINAGANDYLTKPVDLTDLVLRVRNAVAMKRLHDDVAENLRRLQELERLRDGLTHMVIHDLRSPLAAIVMALDLIDTDAGADSARSSDVAIARRSAHTMAEMISGLLDVSRLEAGAMPIERSEVALDEVAGEVVAPYLLRADGPRVTVEVVTPVVVRADRDVVRRVIANLVSNAVKYAPARDGVVRIVIARDKADALVEVIDNGPGIAAEDHATIFEKFGQVRDCRARLGTGLGLTFCKLAVEAHGGRISVDSRAGTGSRFLVRLPLIEG